MVVHSVANYRAPALSGDVTIQSAEVVEKIIADGGSHIIKVKHAMENQRGAVMCTGTAELELPKKPY